MHVSYFPSLHLLFACAGVAASPSCISAAHRSGQSNAAKNGAADNDPIVYMLKSVMPEYMSIGILTLHTKGLPEQTAHQARAWRKRQTRGGVRRP